MTLREWSEANRILPTHPTTETGAVSIVVDHLHPARPQLWRLDDYIVSTVSGPVVWFTPRSRDEIEHIQRVRDSVRNVCRL